MKFVGIKSLSKATDLVDTYDLEVDSKELENKNFIVNGIIVHNSNGIEPSFSHHYYRNVTVEGKKTRQQESVYSAEFLEYKNSMTANLNYTDEELLADLPAYFVTADSLPWQQHVEMVGMVQKWVDSSISKTINCPTDITIDEFKDVYKYAFELGCKAISTFRYNPEFLGSILDRKEDLEKTHYSFELQDGTVVVLKGSDKIEYDGEVTTAANLFNALKEQTYGKF